MRRAVDVAKHSRAEERPNPPPRVGAVIVKDGKLLGESYRGEKGPGDHAEYGLLKDLEDEDLRGAVVFTTLEPCSRRNHPKLSCAQRLVEAGVSTVWIGMYDPNPKIYREGWRILRDAGVTLRDFEADLRAEIAADNAAFLDQFRTSASANGTATFNYLLNGGAFVVDVDGERIRTRWSAKNKGSIRAVGDSDRHTAAARYAISFDQIDDPSALAFSSRDTAAAEGEIVVFQADSGYAFLLVRVVEVLLAERGSDRDELTIEWQLRSHSAPRDPVEETGVG
jgi:diaminohydroxyphosphoribosylaminopyrimidine deaminase/5-amino-6-(5-phosphoribosylamino)uracil reductase